ncbi:MAG: lysozyme inhibitor LprI family protein [Alphaproteobacteria bacterium]|nr:lysozyme inhibitor LprI family protein [Alphaproteobacteria bacterium]
MRQLFFALALLVTACVTLPARADVLQSDARILDACIAQASGDRVALQQCVGVMTRVCIEAEGGSNSMTDVLCRSSESLAWNAIIEAATERITAADPADGALLAAANNAWTDWREAECSYRAYEFGGGSGEQYDRVTCDLELTSSRAIGLIAN